MSCKIQSGRKRESAVWNYFMYDAVGNRSKCLVTCSDTDDKPCEKQIAGKNSTNLITHLRTSDKTIYAEFVTSTTLYSTAFV